MRMQSQRQLIRAVRRLQRQVCTYDVFKTDQTAKPPNTCDCKYGVSLQPGSEETGCPELREVLAILQAMDEKEFERICQRI